MTKKDFTAIAAAVKSFFTRYGFSIPAENTPDYQAAKSLVEAIARTCALTNPRFDYDKFYRACGLE